MTLLALGLALTCLSSFPSGSAPGPSTDWDGAPPLGTVRLMAVGDVMLARSIGRRIRERGPGFVFRDVQRVLDRADLLVINLECAITTSRDREDKHYTFRAPPLAALALQRAGVDVAGLANNHAMDLGPAGLADTMRLLGEQGIATVGAGIDRRAARKPLVLERNGLRVAFLAYVDGFREQAGFDTRRWRARTDTPGVAIADPDAIRTDVAAARGVADVVVVLIHAGYEYVTVPNAEQRGYARAALDAGAALVLGAHPHVLQGHRRVGTRLVAWSLGNFVFDRMEGASDTVILALDLSAAGVSRVRWIPVRLVKGVPRLT